MSHWYNSPIISCDDQVCSLHRAPQKFANSISEPSFADANGCRPCRCCLVLFHWQRIGETDAGAYTIATYSVSNLQSPKVPDGLEQIEMPLGGQSCLFVDESWCGWSPPSHHWQLFWWFQHFFRRSGKTLVNEYSMFICHKLILNRVWI